MAETLEHLVCTFCGFMPHETTIDCKINRGGHVYPSSIHPNRVPPAEDAGLTLMERLVKENARLRAVVDDIREREPGYASSRAKTGASWQINNALEMLKFISDRIAKFDRGE